MILAGDIKEFEFPEEVNGVNEILRVGNILICGYQSWVIYV